MAEEQKVEKRAAIWPTVLIIVVAGFVGFFIGRGNTGGIAQTTPTDSESNVSVTVGDNSDGDAMAKKDDTITKTLPVTTPEPVMNEAILTVNSQPAGKTAVIARMNLAGTAWLAIHDDTNGKPGNILGAARYFATAKNATFPLLRATVAGTHYFAVVHKDDGDRVFDFHGGDAPLLNSAGEPVAAGFTAQ